MTFTQKSQNLARIEEFQGEKLAFSYKILHNRPYINLIPAEILKCMTILGDFHSSGSSGIIFVLFRLLRTSWSIEFAQVTSS